MIWPKCKRKYDQHIVQVSSGTQEEVLKTWDDIIKCIPTLHWKYCVDHTEKNISEALDTENGMNVFNIKPGVLNLSDSLDIGIIFRM